MKTDNVAQMVFAVLSLVIALTASACASGDQQIYGLGDVVNIGSDMRMILSSAEFIDDKLEATFTIENVGAEEHHYNLVLSLQARNTEGTPMSQLIPCGSNLDGALQPGEQVTGKICWITDGADVVRIHYLVLLSDTDIAWDVTG